MRLTNAEKAKDTCLGAVMAAVAAAGPFWLGQNCMKISNETSATDNVITVNRKDRAELANITLAPGAPSTRAYSNESL